METENRNQRTLISFMSTLLFISMLFSCQRNPQISCKGIEKFNRTKWAEVADLMSFPNRNCMVDDLVLNYHLKGKPINEIINLLGEPQYPIDSTMEMGYK